MPSLGCCIISNPTPPPSETKSPRLLIARKGFSFVRTDGDRIILIDYRVYHKAHDGITKNEHFLAMLLEARQRGFTPACVVFDSWYASVDNLRLIRDCGWRWLT